MFHRHLGKMNRLFIYSFSRITMSYVTKAWQRVYGQEDFTRNALFESCVLCSFSCQSKFNIRHNFIAKDLSNRYCVQQKVHRGRGWCIDPIMTFISLRMSECSGCCQKWKPLIREACYCFATGEWTIRKDKHSASEQELFFFTNLNGGYYNW